MPTSTWTCKLSWDNVIFTDPSPGNPNVLEGHWQITFTCICQPVEEPMPQYNTLVDYGSFDLSVGYIAGSGTFAGVSYRFGDAEINVDQWFSHPSTPSASGFLLSDFTSGGTLTITKDYDSDLITFDVGFTSWAVPLSGFDAAIASITPGSPSYLNTMPLVPQGYTATFTLADPTFSYPAYDLNYSVQFFNIIAQENGVTYHTITLASGDPGNWWPDVLLAADPLVGVTRFEGEANIQPWYTRSQQPTRQKLDAAVTAMDFPSYRIFDYFRHLQSAAAEVDLIHAMEHGAHWIAEVMGSADTLTWARTHDKGRSYANGMIYMAGGTTNTSPSITWKMGRLNVVWHNGSAILQSFSLDLGQNWSSPVTLSITGTNPRHLVDPATGFSWYFYVTGGDLKVQRSGDYGATFIGSAVTVVTGISTQTVGAQLALDGSLLVVYIDTGTLTQKRSTDLGLSWS